MRRFRVCLGLLALAVCSCSLPGCTPFSQAKLLTDETRVLSDANTALTAYQLAKLVATGVAAVDPKAGLVIMPALVLTDTYAARLRVAVNDISIDQASVTTLVAQINAQTAAIKAMACGHPGACPPAPPAA